MAIHYRCVCGQALHAPAAAALHPARCPACGVITPVPAESTIEPHPETQRAIPEAVAPDAGNAAENADGGGESKFVRGGFGGAAGGSRRLQKTAAAERGVRTPVFRTKPSAASSLTPPPTADREPDSPVWRYLFYAIILAALIPLMIWPSREVVSDKLEALAFKTFRAHAGDPRYDEGAAKAAAAFNGSSAFGPGDYLNFLPDQRIDGALLGANSAGHWAMSLVALGVLGLAIAAVGLAMGRSMIGSIMIALLAVGCGALLFLILSVMMEDDDCATLLIGWLLHKSYTLSLERNVPAVLGMLAFAGGFGLILTAAKAIPLLAVGSMGMGAAGAAGSRSRLIWVAMPVGLGLGLAESTTYAGIYYNGVEGFDAYFVHLLSVVALQVVWTVILAVSLHRAREVLIESESWQVYVLRVLGASAVPLALHAATDTFLKRDARWAALAVALASVAWMVVLLERAAMKRT